MCHTIGEGKERANRANIPDIFVAKTVLPESAMVCFFNLLSMEGDLEREV